MKRGAWVMFLGLLVPGFCAVQAMADQKKNVSGHHAYSGGDIVDNALAYSFPDERLSAERGRFDLSQVSPGKIPVGTIIYAGSTESPGVVVGNTWYDWQQNCSMGRMIECGPHSGEEGYTVVHMGWMYLPDEFLAGYRSYAYNAYKSSDHNLLVPTYLAEFGVDYQGFVNVDATPDNRAIVGGHGKKPGLIEDYSPELYYDDAPASANFPNSERVPDTVATYGQLTATDCCWPKFFFQFGTDTVMHVAAQMFETSGLMRAVMYFRKVGYEGAAEYEWDYPPYVVDTVYDIAQDIIGQRTGDRVCLVWFASLPYTETPYVPGCDTCSGTSFYDGFQIGQMDNDIYYQESLDQGASWQPRVNVTQCVIGAAGDKAYCDASVLYDSDDNLHVVWNAIPWPADFCMDDTGKCWSDDWSIKNARLMHWSENVPYIREVAEQVYDVDPAYEWIDSCRAGSWNANISKPSLSECDGRLYVLWTQFNNPREGIVDDCAQWALDEPQGEGRNGGANGELWVSVSEDWGMNWDYQRNLTNSYTPGCDPTWEDDCESDHWPSMSRTGRQVQTGTYPEDWSGAVEVDPSGGSYTGDYYLDILYVNDADAGGVVVGEGGWTNNPIKWFRMPCVEPVGAPSFTVNWTNLDEPASVFPGEYLDTTLIIKNIGNTALTYSVEIVYDSGATGWLDASGFTGSIPSGLANTEVGYLRLNYQMWTDTSDGYAHLHFTGNDPNNLPADIYVKLVMADTILVVFAPSVDYSVGMYPSSVHSADLDGDDDIDLAVTNTESDDVSILLNNGDGTFATAVNYAVNDQPVSVCGADFDDDDDQDLAVANAGSDNVSVLTNNGDGTFDDLLKTGWTTTLGVADYGVGSGPRSVFTCDLDGDDDDDLATANSESDNVSVLTNNGDGTFGAADNHPVGDCPVSVHGNDLDNDTDNDLAVANYSSNTVSVLKNNGDATFEGVVDYGVGSGPRSVLTCDLDGDGDCDIVTANEGSDDISVLLNYSDATFADAVSYPVGDSAMSVDAGDIDGDGDLDLIVANFGSDSVSVLINRGDATFEGVVDYGVGSGPRAVHLADLDGDNVCDIATANSLADSVTVLINLGEEPDDDCLLRGDFNRSGQFDILDIDDFIDYLFRDGLPPVSLEEIDVDDNGQIDILDIDYMVDYLFRGGPEPVPCP